MLRRTRRLTISAALAAAFVVAVMSSPAAAADRDPSTILVKFSIPSQTAGILQAFGDRIGAQLGDGVIMVRLSGGASVDAAVARYSHLFGVGYAEPNYIASIDALPAPNDPSYGSQWSLSKISAVNGWSALFSSYPTATNGATIAVVDTGVQADHPDLNGKVLTGAGANCVSGLCTAGGTADDNNHGTHVSGIAAARTNDGVGIAGLALTSPILPVKVLNSSGSGSYAAIAAGINWAVGHGANVINMSLSGSSFSTTLCNAVSNAIAANVVVVAAAGNSASTSRSYPAACSGAIGVGATDSSDASASYSNYGSPNVFVTAPGSAIYSTIAGSSYDTYSGTSMASPHVAALVALLQTQSPGISVASVKKILATTSDKIPSSFYGSDPYGTCAECTWSLIFGYGRINVERALAAGGSVLPSPPPPSQAPSLGTFTVNGVTQSAATVAGTVNPNGSATSWWVEYGPTASYTKQTDPQSLGTGSSPVSVSANLTGLTANTTYHYRVVASSANGTTASGDSTFATAAAPPPAGSVTLAFPSSVTITSGTAAGGSATSLVSTDGRFFVVRAPLFGSPSWYGTFDVAPNPSDFKVTYNGLSSRSCTLSLSLYRWPTSTWVTVGSSITLGASTVTVTDAAPPASVSPADFRSASGQVLVRATCTAGFSYSPYTLSNDLLQLSYRS